MRMGTVLVVGLYRVTGNKLSWHKRHDAGIQDMRVYTAYYTITIINNGKANGSFNALRDSWKFVFLTTCDPNCYNIKRRDWSLDSRF